LKRGGEWGRGKETAVAAAGGDRGGGDGQEREEAPLATAARERRGIGERT